MPRSRVRSPRRFRSAGPRDWARRRSCPGRSRSKCRAVSTTPLGLLAQGGDGPRRHPGHGASVQANPRPMVGGAGLVLRGDDGVGLGASAERFAALIATRRDCLGLPRGSRVCYSALFAAVFTVALRAAQHLAGISVLAARPAAGRRLDPLGRGRDLHLLPQDRRVAPAGPTLRPRRPALRRWRSRLGLSVSVQLNPNHLNHLSRWGHWAAGRWLSAHAAPDEEVLDTRGWGRFVSGRPGYDYWHVRQALTDSRLSYILVGLDELKAASSRAATLRAVLAYVGTPLVDFPASPGDPTPAVQDLPLSTPGLMGRNRPVNLRIALATMDARRELDVGQRALSRLPPVRLRRGPHDPRHARSPARQAGPIDGPGRLPRAAKRAERPAARRPRGSRST